MEYLDLYPKQQSLHHEKRAAWIKKRCRERRVIDFGCSYGYLVKILFEKGVNVFGVDENKYALDNSVIPDRVFSHLPIEPEDFLVSWNVLDAVADQATAEQVASMFGIADRSYHVLCTDDGRPEAENFKKDGFFIKPIEWWLERVDDHVVLVDYFSGKPYNTNKELKMPLSWGLISK